ncbi:MAG: alpha/beta fold hydrolase [Acidobacteria bacterium]|nr:alpha/beta fold hydrolase [Acidobacteriota bacterium]
MNCRAIFRWLRRLGLALAVFTALFLFVILPVGASFLITNGRFRFPERGPKTAEEAGLPVMPVEFTTTDGIPLRGWWSPGEPSMPVIIFAHGLNRSRLELLERGAESNRRGYGVLLFDLRNHGESGRAYTTIGIHESRDVCAAGKIVKEKSGNRPQILWGVSMGASSAILAARQCPGFSAIVSDSAFLSFRETIAHHLRLFFGLPAFPIANLIVGITALRMGFNPGDGDVEASVREIGVPILFIAGGRDRRMPPALAERMLNASRHPLKKLLLVPEAGHGEAFATDRTVYLNSVFQFLENVRYNSVLSHKAGGS